MPNQAFGSTGVESSTTTTTHGILKRTVQAAVVDHGSGRTVRVTSVHMVDQLPRAINAHMAETDVHSMQRVLLLMRVPRSQLPWVELARVRNPASKLRLT
jgi:hypothetical protein